MGHVKGAEREYSMRQGGARGAGRGDWTKGVGFERLEVAGKDRRNIHVG